MKKIKRLIMMVGAPGSGKTAYAKKVLSENDIYISRDEVRAGLRAESSEEEWNRKIEKRVARAFVLDLIAALEETAGNGAVFADATHVSKKARKRVMDSLKEVFKDEVVFEAIFINTPLEECLRRNEGREGEALVPKDAVRRLYNAIQPPDKSEGFEMVSVVGQNCFKRNKTVWFTSDFHFGHDKPFIWESRGYTSVEHMNREQVRKFNEKVQDGDDVYILGDLVVGDTEQGIECIKKLNGNLYLIEGNHDTERRLELYATLPNVKSIKLADSIKRRKKNLFLCHYPMDSTHKDPRSPIISVHGHTHSKEKFNAQKMQYNVAVDAHDGYPVSIDELIDTVKGLG